MVLPSLVVNGSACSRERTSTPRTYTPTTGVLPPDAGAEITPVEPDPGNAGEGREHGRDACLGHRAGPRPAAGARPPGHDAALGQPRRLAARARRRRAARPGALAAGRRDRDRRGWPDRLGDARRRR